MIVVAGEALIDLLVHPDGRLAAVPGGGPFNTARTIGRLGWPRSRSSAGCRPIGSAAILRAALASRRRRPSLADADRRADHAGRRRARRRPGPRATGSTRPTPPPPSLTLEAARAGARRRGRGPSIVGTLGLVARAVATALATAVAAVGVDTLVMVDPNCRPRVIPRPRGLSRPPRAHPGARRRRQGQRRRPRLPRAGTGCLRRPPRAILDARRRRSCS